MSNLTNEEQKYIHSTNFKEKFGDWEKIQRLEKLKNSETIVRDGQIIIDGKDVTEEVNNLRKVGDIKSLRILAKLIGKKIRGTYHNEDTNIDVYVGTANIDEIKRHHVTYEGHLEAIQYIPNIINKSIFITEEKNEDLQKHPRTIKYQYYACGIKIAGIDYTCKSAIGIDGNGHHYYDQRLSQIEKGTLLDNLSQIMNRGVQPMRSSERTPVDNLSPLMSRGKSTRSIHDYDMRLLRICQVPQAKYLDENLEPTRETIELVKNGKLHIVRDNNGFEAMKTNQNNQEEPMTEQENEPRVYNADEVITVEDEMTGGLGLDWNCIDGTTRSYIELDTGKDYGTTTWGEKQKLYIEKADSYSREYPFILAIGGAYEDVLNDIAERQNVYPDVDNVAEEYNAGEDYSKRFNDNENVELIGFKNEEDTTKFIIDTFDKHLYDRAFNQMIAKDTYMDSQTLENHFIGYVDPAWRNEEGKCAFDYNTDEADKLVQFYKDNDMEIPVAAQGTEQEHEEVTAPAAEAPKPHYTVERVPFGEWMARPENAAMRPLIDTIKGHKEIPLYVYTIPNDAKGHDGKAVAISINSHPGRQAVAMFSMCCREKASKDGQSTLHTVYRDETNDYKTFSSAEHGALHQVLESVGIDEVRNKDRYTFQTEPFKTNKDLLTAYFKVTKAYMTRSADKNWNDFLAAGGDALSHFTKREQKQISIALKALGASDPERLGKILMRSVNGKEKRQEKSRDSGYER